MGPTSTTVVIIDTEDGLCGDVDEDDDGDVRSDSDEDGRLFLQ